MGCIKIHFNKGLDFLSVFLFVLALALGGGGDGSGQTISKTTQTDPIMPWHPRLMPNPAPNPFHPKKSKSKNCRLCKI